MGRIFIDPMHGITDWGRLSLVLVCACAWACFTSFHLDKAGARNVAVLLTDTEVYMARDKVRARERM